MRKSPVHGVELGDATVCRMVHQSGADPSHSGSTNATSYTGKQSATIDNASNVFSWLGGKTYKCLVFLIEPRSDDS